MTLIRGVNLAGQSFSPRRRTAVTKRGGAAPGLCGTSYVCHRVDHLSCPHHCSGGRRLPHSSTAQSALAVATRHWSRFPLCSSLSARAWLSAWPRRPANQQAGKAANQEAGTHCVPQTLKNMSFDMTESLFESKNHHSQHIITITVMFGYYHTLPKTLISNVCQTCPSTTTIKTMKLGRPLPAQLNRPTT